MASLLPPGGAQTLLGLARILIALLFLQHGTAKLLGFPHVAMFDGLKLVSLLGLAGAIEILGGLLLLLGLFTRPTAIVLAAEMVVAYVVGHAGRGALPLHNGGELALVYGVVFLLFALAGPGRFALDRLFGGRA
ncbi:hypothetical+protein [Methylocapsa aurea]|uniref:DoxX family protein n=1 Tax=Methylocapsa aurea TaxID=663610 RepID=UPI003D189768